MTARQDSTAGQIDPVVCTCVDLTEGQLRAEIAENPALGFDDILQRTGAGTTCTACLLDLEYIFSRAERGPAAGVHGRGGGAKAEAAHLGVKQSLYALIDGLAPKVPYRLVNTLPVLALPGLRQFVCVANDSLLYRGAESAPPTRVELRVRDANGILRHRASHRVESGDGLRVEVGRFVTPHDPTDPARPAIGSVEILRRAAHPGIRGTTRPQIVIEAKAGCCAVHGQAAHVTAAPYWFTFLHRPAEERCFVSVVNVSGGTLRGRVRYPLGIEGRTPEDHPIEVPANGAHLHELHFDPESVQSDRPISLNIHFDGLHKAHFLCASPSLDRFSIDHL
ncbi:MAG: (2Fe-2S)-binding protein [Rhodospirillaceae bacterium]|nr:(2Fe-2S)-binding protein [Rhodospirillaceae bacterium]